MDIKSLTISQRLRLFLDSLNVEQQEFANALGVSQQVVSNAVNGRTKFPKSDFLVLMINAYPNLNLYWLLKGEGEMLNDENLINSEKYQTLKAENDNLRKELLDSKNKIIELLEKLSS